ncbi:hypothetical protein GCM10017567_07560 [Amycolatopsis bullii]|uniref:Uncharacterized protein n=1 Tax=Amycolatopsis bullii TaxID=941987 RepID=A0ABQ3K1F8_9PSEU|nr:hypothetical protein GCM10017567_07560 [Amycolatopsis bullii]
MKTFGYIFLPHLQRNFFSAAPIPWPVFAPAREPVSGHRPQWTARREARAPGRAGHDGGMKLGQLAATARDLFSARLVYGDPVERDGTVVIPAAAVRRRWWR